VTESRLRREADPVRGRFGQSGVTKAREADRARRAFTPPCTRKRYGVPTRGDVDLVMFTVCECQHPLPPDSGCGWA
jgi:hypothetical protein